MKPKKKDKKLAIIIQNAVNEAIMNEKRMIVNYLNAIPYINGRSFARRY